MHGFKTVPVEEVAKEKLASGARVRLWLDDQLVIDAWDEITLEIFKTTYHFTRELASPPILLHAGERVPIKIEYACPGGPDAHLHLYWLSRSFDLRHVPREYLYSAEAGAKNPEKKPNRR